MRISPLRAAACLATCALTACSGQESSVNVLLITVDTLRADRLGCYGYERETSPRIDAFAKEAVLFENAYSHAPFTAPSHAALFTSLHNQGHGVTYWGQEIRDEVETFAERFRDAGWRTGAFYNMPVLEKCDVQQGFEEVQLRYYEPADDTVDAFLEWAEARSAAGESFASWVHLWDVHRPYGFRDWDTEYLATRVDREDRTLAYEEERFGAAPDVRIGRTNNFYGLTEAKRKRVWNANGKKSQLGEADFRYIADRYDGGVWYADRALGDLFDGLRERGLLDETLVVLTSDHGETLMERESCYFHHDSFLFEETLKVPLIIRFPDGWQGGTRIDPMARGIDVLPTMLDVANLPANGTLGRSLVPVIEGGDTRSEILLFAETVTPNVDAIQAEVEGKGPNWREYRQLVFDGRLKLIHDTVQDRLFLYDLEQDPSEQTNVVDDARYAEDVARLREKLASFNSMPAGAIDEGEMDSDLLQMLKDSGYIGDEPTDKGH